MATVPPIDSALYAETSELKPGSPEYAVIEQIPEIRRLSVDDLMDVYRADIRLRSHLRGNCPWTLHNYIVVQRRLKKARAGLRGVDRLLVSETTPKQDRPELEQARLEILTEIEAHEHRLADLSRSAGRLGHFITVSNLRLGVVSEILYEQIPEDAVTFFIGPPPDMLAMPTPLLDRSVKELPRTFEVCFPLEGITWTD